MRKRFLLPLLVLLLTTLSTHAYDFKSGDLYYNITSDTTVEVTYPKYWNETYYQGLTTATIPATVTNDGTIYSVTSIGDQAFSGCSALTSITIPESVTSIGYAIFRNCSALTSITIPNSVTSIGESAFYYCTSLTSITIPNSVTSIGSSAFSGCSALTTITIPNSVASIGGHAFSGCSSLTSITIPNSVTSIGSDAFSGCSSLPVVDNLRYADTYLVEAVDKSLSTYTIKAGTTWIGNYAFSGCSALTSITIPYSVTSIGEGAFWDCSSLTSITIPNSVTSIGDGAFYYCPSLTSITCLATTPPTCGQYCFDEVPRTIPLYVPDEAVEDYKAAAVWQEFNIVAESDAPTAIENALNTDTKGVQKLLRNGQVLILRNGETYDMMGQRL